MLNRAAGRLLPLTLGGVDMIAALAPAAAHARQAAAAWHTSAAPRSRPLPQRPRLAGAGADRRRDLLLCRGLPADDFDDALISRRSVSSGLQPPRSHPLADGGDSGSSSDLGGPPSPSPSSSPEPDGGGGGVSAEEAAEHKRAAVQQAFLNGRLAFGFSAGGLIFPYYVGLVSSLVEAGVLERPSQLAGSSAGSLIAASFNAGLDMATVEASMVEFGEDCLKRGTRYRLGPLLRGFLEQYLPPDAHESCSGTTHVAVTRLLPYWRSQMVSQFESRDDLISALLTSCHIPWYFDGRWMTKFRGHFCVDGGVMAFVPTVPGAHADYTVKVMCFPSSHLEGLKASARGSRRLRRLHSLLDMDITMDSHEPWPYDLQQIVKWALVASAQETSSLLIEKGKRDAALWVESMELAPLVERRQQQQQQQREGEQREGEQLVRSDSSADATVVIGSGGGEAVSAAAAVGAADRGAWSDRKPAGQRGAEAQAAHSTAAHAEAAAAAAGDGVGVHEVAAAAGVDARAAEHAEEAVEMSSEPPAKRLWGAAAAATAAAAAPEAGAEAVGAAAAGWARHEQSGGDGGGDGGGSSRSSGGGEGGAAAA